MTGKEETEKGELIEPWKDVVQRSDERYVAHFAIFPDIASPQGHVCLPFVTKRKQKIYKLERIYYALH